MVTDASFNVTVLFCAGPRTVHEVALVVELGCTAGQAVVQSGLLSSTTQADLKQLELGVWGRRVASEYLLRARDRVEIYRSLKVDPKVARRERFAKQGAKTAGLFAKRRVNSKAGY
jgi:putative ubiquitin-RnfH superfamily antitoxin RatB of RatAB toxin-antitoxin module